MKSGFSSSCIGGCLDVIAPVESAINKHSNGRLSLLHRWAEEDKEFLMRMASNNKNDNNLNKKVVERSAPSSSTELVLFSASPSPVSDHLMITPSPGRDYACRQRYLRTYTLQKKEKVSAAQRTRSWIQREIKNNYYLKSKSKNKKEEKDGGETKSAGKDVASGGGGGTSNCNSLLQAASAFFFMCMVKVDVHQ